MFLNLGQERPKAQKKKRKHKGTGNLLHQKKSILGQRRRTFSKKAAPKRSVCEEEGGKGGSDLKGADTAMSIRVP